MSFLTYLSSFFLTAVVFNHQTSFVLYPSFAERGFPSPFSQSLVFVHCRTLYRGYHCNDPHFSARIVSVH